MKNLLYTAIILLIATPALIIIFVGLALLLPAGILSLFLRKLDKNYDIFLKSINKKGKYENK